MVAAAVLVVEALLVVDLAAAELQTKVALVAQAVVEMVAQVAVAVALATEAITEVVLVQVAQVELV